MNWSSTVPPWRQGSCMAATARECLVGWPWTIQASRRAPQGHRGPAAADTRNANAPAQVHRCFACAHTPCFIMRRNVFRVPACIAGLYQPNTTHFPAASVTRCGAPVHAAAPASRTVVFLELSVSVNLSPPSLAIIATLISVPFFSNATESTVPM